MREILFKAKRSNNGEWFEGVPVDVTPLQCFSEPQVKEIVMVRAGFADWGMPRTLEYTKVDPETVCQYTGEMIRENVNTTDTLLNLPVKVWEDDLIAIYTITEDDDDNPVRNRIAVVRVQWDDVYKMLYAQCVEGDMETIADQCNISCLDGMVDYPFTFWLEYMENSRGPLWEWEVIGNIHDKEGEHD